MKRYWLQIKIGNKLLNPILIFDGNSACTALSMKTLSCNIKTSYNTSSIPVSFGYVEEYDNKRQIVYNECIQLVKQTNVISSLLGNIFRGITESSLQVEVYFNDTNEGLCIGFLSSRFKPTKYLVKKKFRGIKAAETPNGVPDIFSAKETFVSNYSAWGDLLKLSSETNDENISKWEKCISSIPNSSDLQVEFSKYKNNLETWIKLLQSWGLKKDGCKQYPGILADSNRYDLVNQEQIHEDANYIVLIPCWTIWIDTNGIKTEKNVSKGILKQK